ncbi:four helix bundle protein [Candidatus Wolfebacteria bacterium CG_4_10_14_0_8_um_filter_37_11]|uniref:Four helix bundle protein n=1 Tax=Candidatus Wolfebacteria bacterium CG_4_10_14_0_8_um_filter_37_11 TaxID=1975062 RepID=A0A2M7Q9M9_9BACT|nr:MAG: four helix bundle protein [Candidatus Wolfebacteria bacterium CG_4_10_14_0_8_um_filter_37_11]
MKTEVKNFYDLKVWQDAHRLTLKIYKETKNFPKEEQFGLISQMRRASSSITANIAEGFGRFHYKEKIKFYLQSRGSAVELQNHIFLSQDLDYLTKQKARDLFQQADIVLKELNGLINSINKQLNL